MGQAEEVVVRLLLGKKECDKFQKGLPHKRPSEHRFKTPEEAADFVNQYKTVYAYRGFGLFTNKSIPIEVRHFRGLRFIQYEF